MTAELLSQSLRLALPEVILAVRLGINSRDVLAGIMGRLAEAPTATRTDPAKRSVMSPA